MKNFLLASFKVCAVIAVVAAAQAFRSASIDRQVAEALGREVCRRSSGRPQPQAIIPVDLGSEHAPMRVKRMLLDRFPDLGTVVMQVDDEAQSATLMLRIGTAHGYEGMRVGLDCASL